VAKGYVSVLLLLAAIWGSSFMFIKLALEDLSPSATMFGRCLVATLMLGGILVVRRGLAGAVGCLREFGRAGIVLGVVSTALPFWLIAWGETRIDSGIAAIANATMPIFVALLAIRFAPGERVTGSRAFGIVLGLVGVGVLVGIDPQGGWAGAVGTLAVVLASVSYAVSTLYSQRKLGDSSGLLVSTASAFWGAVVLLPFALFQAPAETPGLKALASVAALGVFGTGIGLLLFLYMIEHYGSTRASLVVYLLPVTALGYGAFFLDEEIRVTAIVGLALILAGVALGSGVVKPVRRREPAAVHAP
jgi:drug/metabolite transporter (DMT)-like permease